MFRLLVSHSHHPFSFTVSLCDAHIFHFLTMMLVVWGAKHRPYIFITCKRKKMQSLCKGQKGRKNIFSFPCFSSLVRPVVVHFDLHTNAHTFELHFWQAITIFLFCFRTNGGKCNRICNVNNRMKWMHICENEVAKMNKNYWLPRDNWILFINICCAPENTR